MDLHSDLILNTCESCNTVLTLNTCYTYTVESIGKYILEQSVSVKAISIIIFGLGGDGSLIFRRKLITVWHISV